jgi:ketosteroid isomerase-like protein
VRLAAPHRLSSVSPVRTGGSATVAGMQTETSIRQAAAQLDRALEAGDVERVVAYFDPECEIELLGVRLRGHDGVRRWLGWISAHAGSIAFTPRVISVQGDTLVEEFEVAVSFSRGRRVRSRWAEVLTYRADLVTSLRLYFNPIDLAPTLGLVGRLLGPVAARLARRGLQPYAVLETPD